MYRLANTVVIAIATFDLELPVVDHNHNRVVHDLLHLGLGVVDHFQPGDAIHLPTGSRAMGLPRCCTAWTPVETFDDAIRQVVHLEVDTANAPEVVDLLTTLGAYHNVGRHVALL